MVADSMTQDHHLSDKELIGQGIGNTIAGFFSALPGAGATMRTAINIRSGGRTALSGIIHSLTLLIIVLWAGDYVQFVPHALLAGILMKVGMDIIDWRFIKKLNKMGTFSVSLMLLVLLLTVFVDLITAVLVGMFVANLVTLDRLANIQLDHITFTQSDALLTLYGESNPTLEQRLKETLLLEIEGPVSFAVSRELGRRCNEHSQFSTLIIDLSQAKLIGTTTSLMIVNIIEQSVTNNKEVLIVTGNEKVKRSLAKLCLEDLLTNEQQFISRALAIDSMKQ
jgi:SulP family sulfate permease